MHTLITLAFVGTQYHGFQVQQNALSICEVLQDAMQQLYHTRPAVKGCSRTDSGVHAMGYCVSFTQPKPIDPFKLPLALNRFLPPDIRVLHARMVPEDFHARYHAQSKEYIYRIHNSAIDDVFAQGQSWRIAPTLDVDKMHAAAQHFVGKHDFASFMSSGSTIEDTVREIYFFNVTRQGCDITFHVCANGYLYNMVRILVGTLVEVGTKRMPVERIPFVLSSKDRAQAGDTAPAHGLFLYKVNYPTISEKE